jgi:hypothetical protein
MVFSLTVSVYEMAVICNGYKFRLVLEFAGRLQHCVMLISWALSYVFISDKVNCYNISSQSKMKMS